VTRSHTALAVVLAILAVLLFAVRPSGQVEPALPTSTIVELPAPRGYVCYRAKSPPTIDGRLDDAVWQDAPWSEPFRDIEGERKPDPPLRTRMKMLWDDQALYIAAELEEPHVWATLRDHDSVIFHDPDFEVFLDPDSDSHLYAELELNALNTTWDLLLSKPYKDGGKAINAWEITGLKTAVHVDGTLNNPADKDRGWTIEIAWPWPGLKQLATCPAPPNSGDQWRINFSRVEWDMEIVDGTHKKIPKRPEHNWVWSPQGVIDMHRPERWGIVQFSTGEPGTTTFYSDPAQPARDYLHRVYYAQAEYRKAHHAFASSLCDLGVSLGSGPLAAPRLETTRNGFEASVELVTPDAGRTRWRITQDARITPDVLPIGR
jgi:Carbohydrate family 9 binding domain-like